MDEDTDRTTMATGVGGAGVSLLRGVALTGLAVAEALLLLWISFCVLLVSVGVGVLLLPGALDAARRVTGLQRRLAGRWSGVRVDEQHYLVPAAGQPGFSAAARRAYRMLGDRATWRDLRWLLVNPFVGPVLGLLPAVAVVEGAAGLTMPFMWRTVTETWGWDNSWFVFIPLVNQTTAVLAALLGAVEIVVGLVLARVLLRVHGRWVRYMLDGLTRAALNDRVQHLAHSRSDAVSQQAAELSRIERDLHDGAQSRLVAMGMTLSAAEALLDANPQAARALVAEAKNSSASALRELRDLVRGIHPPVLADRGLVDAVRARALELPTKVTVTADVAGRVPPPVESAVYFVISELLNNAVKYAQADQIAVDLRYTAGRLRVNVHDNGVGGVDPDRGSGIRGVERRLLPFDGYLTVLSPIGGPTDVAVEVPCDLMVAS